jgi:hypothetical protein
VSHDFIDASTNGSSDTSLHLDGPGKSYVEVVADSVSEHSEDRIISYEINAWRFTLAEWNTHCSFAKNSASSRAIPVTTQLEAYWTSPALPYSWPAEKPGMQGGEQLTDSDLFDAQMLFEKIHTNTYQEVAAYVESHPGIRLHKSVLNRLLEPMQWHKMLITMHLPATNFFSQRADPAAQPEFRVLAELMQDLAKSSEPTPMVQGQWHLPYVSEGERELSRVEDLCVMSVARCARTSTNRQHTPKDYADELSLYTRLRDSRPMHASPFEHVATPDGDNQHYGMIRDPDGDGVEYVRIASVGKFPGWLQYRHIIESRLGIDSYK